MADEVRLRMVVEWIKKALAHDPANIEQVLVTVKYKNPAAKPGSAPLEIECFPGTTLGDAVVAKLPQLINAKLAAYKAEAAQIKTDLDAEVTGAIS